MPTVLEVRGGLLRTDADVLTPRALNALEALVPLDDERRELMAARIRRRTERARDKRPIGFLDESAVIPGTNLLVREARSGQFAGCDIPRDLQRQWIQGTGPATRPRASLQAGLRNTAYALLSGADGWMFDGEDALGQTETMSLANQRNLRLAFAGDPAFLSVAEQVADDMNAWAGDFFGRPIIDDWRRQLEFTTRIFRPRGLHLDDRHVGRRGGSGFSASIVDTVLFVAANHDVLRREGRSIVLYLPKVQTAEEAALWKRILAELEGHLGLRPGTIKVYLLVEQLEAAFQLMEIRATLGIHFVGFNTGRWDYINSVSDARRWDPNFVHPDIGEVGMTYGYMRAYEDRVRRAVNMPDRDGRFALWQGGMEAQVPVGSAGGVEAAMRKAVAGAEREQREGASGKWVAHWKMVHIIRPVWERAGKDNQMGRAFPPLTHTPADAAGLVALEPGPRTVRGARNLVSVSIQYGNAFLRGYGAAALKPADFFDADDVLYLMEDMATGEIRLSILWEWLHKGAAFTEDDGDSGVQVGTVMTTELFARLLDEEYAKLLAADDRNVHGDSKATTLPVARAIVEAYVRSAVKLPWYVDLLNLNLGHHDLGAARARIGAFIAKFASDGSRVTQVR